MPREQYDTTVTQETQTFSAAETEAASSGYPGGVPPFRQSQSSANGRSPSSYSGTSYGDPSSVTQAMTTPPYGENYGYGSGGSPTQSTQSDDPRRQNGARSHARHGSTGEAGRAARQTHPQDGYQDTGSNPAGGYQGSGSYQGTGSHRTGGYPTVGYPTVGYPTGGYPDGGHQGNGHQTGAYQTGPHQGNANAYRSNGHRAPYDPREDYRRLTHLG